MTTPFLYPNIGVNAQIFRKLFLQVKKRYVKQPLVKFLQQVNEYSENDFVSKLLDNFLASRFASLTTKSSHCA